MDLASLVFALVIGALAVTMVNAQALVTDDVRRERYARHGVLKPGGAPDADAPAGFIEREKRAERLALVGSAVLTAVAAVALVVLRFPDFQSVSFLLLSAAFVGRTVVLAVLAAREAFTRVGRGQRVSRGGVRGLAQRVPVWAWAVVTLAQVVFLVLYVPQSGALRPELQGWVVGVAVASLVVTVAGWIGAWWLARQPQLASDVNELAWSDQARSGHLAALLLAGPQLAIAVMVSAFFSADAPLRAGVGSLPLLAWAYLVFSALVGLLAAATRRRHAAKPEVHHAGR